MKKINRRDAIQLATAGALTVALPSCKPTTLINTETSIVKSSRDNIRHSACRWCYHDIPLEELADRSKDLGLTSIELLNPDEWDVVLNRGMTCAIANGSPLNITKGFNDPQYHKQLLLDYTSIIQRAAEKGIIDHLDYQCDHTAWGVALSEKIGSQNFSLLYDIYHMQIMEGDVIRTITDNMKYISHFHTGGVPGRHEIDETQELNYRRIVEVIAASDFDGYISQEFLPTAEKPLESLRKAIEICSV